MTSGYYDHRPSNQSSFDNSHPDYRAYVSRLAKAQSVLTDIPHYEETRKTFNNTRVSHKEDYEDQPRNQATTQSNEKETPNDVNGQGGEETVYAETDNNRKSQRRRGFGLINWKTFERHY